jgi:hypothetical protein
MGIEGGKKSYTTFNKIRYGKGKRKEYIQKDMGVENEGDDRGCQNPNTKVTTIHR